MGQDSIPSSPGAIAQLQKPEKLSEALARDNLDCWPCRITGASFPSFNALRETKVSERKSMF